MIPSLLIAVALGSGGLSDFKSEFPTASVIESPSGGRLTNAFGFEAAGLGETPLAAARAFLARYGAAFGLTAREELIVRGEPTPGQVVAVRFERRIDGLPLFDGDVVVGVDGKNAVTMVNGTDVPATVKGRARISRKTAVQAARASLRAQRAPEATRPERGWRATGRVIRPVWRVDLTVAEPAGDWRVYVDAETSKVLLRVDLRATSRNSGIVPERGDLERLAPKQ